MPNPNELQRLEEEREDLIMKLAYYAVEAPKAVKEGWLRELRAIERQLGVQGLPYNSSAFGGSDGDAGR